MNDLESEVKPGCPGECPSCGGDRDRAPGGAHGHKMPDQPIKGGLVGSRLALAAVISFLLPIGLGIAGSALAGPDQGRRLIGAIVGLVLGVIIAIMAARVFWKESK